MSEQTSTSVPVPPKTEINTPGMIAALWLYGAVLTITGYLVLKGEMSSPLPPSGGTVGAAFLLLAVGGVLLQVAVVATGVRLGSRR